MIAAMSSPDADSTEQPARPRNPTAQKILEVAADLMSKQGYNGTSIQAVAAKAGVNKALVFYYFESKDKLFDEVLTRYYTQQGDAILNVLRGPGTPVERMHNVLDAYFDYIDEHRLYPRVAQQEIARPDGRHEVIKAVNESTYKLFAAALGDILPADGPFSVRHFFISFAGMIIYEHLYMPVQEDWLWGGQDPLSKENRAERRAHLHGALDAVLQYAGVKA